MIMFQKIKDEIKNNPDIYNIQTLFGLLIVVAVIITLVISTNVNNNPPQYNTFYNYTTEAGIEITCDRGVNYRDYIRLSECSDNITYNILNGEIREYKVLIDN